MPEQTPLVRVRWDGSGPAVTMLPEVGSGAFGTQQVAVDQSFVYYTWNRSVFRVGKGYASPL
ncbi:MAG TPA: hypothetical protein VGJ84_09385 [Polyangiaceae bacterium]|jgi:hypothetical protein